METNAILSQITDESHLPVSEQSLLFRLKRRAEIRRQIKDRKSVQENAPDRIADLLEEAAVTIYNQNHMHKLNAIKIYYDGLREGVTKYAHWKDGAQYVGTCGQSLKQALEEIDNLEAYSLQLHQNNGQQGALA